MAPQPPEVKRYEVNALIDYINDNEMVPVTLTLPMLVKILPKGSVITLEKKKFIRKNAEEVVSMYNERLSNREATRDRDLKVFSRDKLLEWLVYEELYHMITVEGYISFKSPSGAVTSTATALKEVVLKHLQDRFKTLCVGNNSVKYEDNMFEKYIGLTMKKKQEIYTNYITQNNFFENMKQDTQNKLSETVVSSNPTQGPNSTD